MQIFFAKRILAFIDSVCSEDLGLQNLIRTIVFTTNQFDYPVFSEDYSPQNLMRTIVLTTNQFGNIFKNAPSML